MDFQLVIVRGRGASGTIKLGDGVTTVGRHDDCQLRIKSSQVSRKHCELFEKKGMLLVKDLGSSNGTYVNGKKIDAQRVLEPGDELTVGQVTLKVAKIGADARHAPEPPPHKPGDTAVVETVSLNANSSEGETNDVEFDIEFDDDLETSAPLSAPQPSAPAAALSAKPAAKPELQADTATKPQPETSAVPDPPHSADDAVADFLLDIKFEEDE